MAEEKFYANSDSTEININSHSSLFKLNQTKPALQIKQNKIPPPHTFYFLHCFKQENKHPAWILEPVLPAQ